MQIPTSEQCESTTNAFYFQPPKQCRRFTLDPLVSLLRRKIFRTAEPRIESFAEKSWQISPGRIFTSRRAFFLPGQLERITGTAYTDNPAREMIGGIESYQVPTRGFLLKDAWLMDGHLYKNCTRRRLYRRLKNHPVAWVGTEVDRAAIYSTPDGNEFFGLWLTEDCVQYKLAESEGIPVTSNQTIFRHVPEYECWLDMKPTRLSSAFLRELIVFDDSGSTLHKRQRFGGLTDKILSQVNEAPHPGVFLLRRESGVRRIMINEMNLAEYLHKVRGFRIVDITTADVPTIIADCAGANVVIGVEGSQLLHGIMVLRPGGSILTLQPPDRFSGVIKRTTDPNEQHYGFVVGQSEEGGFRIDPSEVERTLDLLPTGI